MASLKICLSTKIQISIVIKLIRPDTDNLPQCSNSQYF